MKTNKRIIIYTIGLLFIVLVLIGFTYGYFLTNIQGNTNTKSIEVSTANLFLEYNDWNGIIEAKNIIPGYTTKEKKFSVTNKGNVPIDDYGVYLEDIINEFKYNEDLVINLSCESSDEIECNGIKNSQFPTYNDLLITNSISSGTTHTYSLSITYKESGTDQSDDMNKKFSGKIQIYNTNDIVNISGTISGTEEGDFLEIHSEPKISYINLEHKYSFIGITPGTHILYLKNNKGVIKYQKEFTINKSNESNLDNFKNITITKSTENVNMNITANQEITLDLISTSNYDLNKENTLASTLIKNAVNNTFGTSYRDSPLTKPLLEKTEKYTGEIMEKYELYKLSIGKEQNYYWTYGSSYEVDQNNGGITILDEKTCKYSDCYKELKDKFIVYFGGISQVTSENNELKQTSGNNLYRIIEAPEPNNTTLIVNAHYIESVPYSTESSLIKTNDDLGDTYYYRGKIDDNYVEFNKMCWRIVRIQGDGSIKLVLANEGICSESTNNSGLISQSNSWNGKIISAYNEKTNSANLLEGGNKDLIYLSENWFEKHFKDPNILSKLVKNDWCNENTIYFESKSTIVYYGNPNSNKNSPSLKCHAKQYTSYISSLTMDEVSLAGARLYSNNYTFYLKDNANTGYWTITPAAYYKTTNEMRSYYVAKYGYLDSLFANQYWGTSIRPAITLKKYIILNGGNGTKNNPFIVK